MPDLVPAVGLDAWRAFLFAHASVVSAIERRLNERGLVPLTWYDVLVAISSAPERRIRMSALAGELALTRSGATRLVDKLEAAGLVKRERSDEDARGSLASLTAEGRVALRKAWPVYAEGIKGLFLSQLSDREVRVVGRALNRVRISAKGAPTSDGRQRGSRELPTAKRPSSSSGSHGRPKPIEGASRSYGRSVLVRVSASQDT